MILGATALGAVELGGNLGIGIVIPPIVVPPIGQVGLIRGRYHRLKPQPQLKGRKIRYEEFIERQNREDLELVQVLAEWLGRN